MQTPLRKCKQTISLNFLILDTSKHLQQTELVSVSFIIFFFFFLTQWLSEANSLSVQDNHNKLFLFFSSALLLFPALLPSPLLTLPFQMSASQQDISHCVACVYVWEQEGERKRLRRITSKISPAFYTQMSSLSLSLSPLSCGQF